MEIVGGENKSQLVTVCYFSYYSTVFCVPVFYLILFALIDTGDIEFIIFCPAL